VNNGRARFIILLLGNPHLLESGQGRQNRPTNPNGVFPLRGGNNFDLHGRRGEVDQLLLHTVGNTGEHSGTSGKDDVTIEILTDVDITFHDGVIGTFMDTRRFTSQKGGLEEGFGTTKSFVSDGYDLTVG